MISEEYRKAEELAAENDDLRDQLAMRDRFKKKEPCEDCISRQAVKEAIYHECSSENLDIDFAKVLLLQRAIKALPSVEPQPKKPNCQSCDNYKKNYCTVLDIKPCYPEKGCDYFEDHVTNIQEICDEVNELSERVDNLEKQVIEKLKAELDYAKFRCSLPDINMNIKEKRHGPWWWECKKCGKMIPYMANFCHECADELLGDQPKPFDPTESEE